MHLPPQGGGGLKEAHWEDLVDLLGVADSKYKLHMILPLKAKAHHILLVSDHI